MHPCEAGGVDGCPSMASVFLFAMLSDHQDWLTDERGWEIISCSHPRHVDQIQSAFASIHWTQVEKETYNVSVSAGSKGSE